VSVDSALVYRGMDIGTAKPTAAERAAVPHHGIDILDPAEAYSAARFVADASAAIADIRARDRLPLLVGGTMLYFKALREGLDPMPAADPAVRAEIEARAAAQGWPALHAELARIDPATAARLAPTDAQRVQRALEVWHLSGRPLSDWQRAGKVASSAAYPLFALEPQSRAWLHARIAQRLEAMFAAGFVDEVQRLHARPGLHAGLPSMRCVGYRQLWQALDAAGGAIDAAGSAAAQAAALAATRQLAKRQLTWLRSHADRQRLVCDDAAAVARAVAALRSAWRASR
jgi:tRNA dimethylallyltransferase